MGSPSNHPSWTATFPFSSAPRSVLTMKPEEQTEEEIILAFAVSDDALEFAASPNFSLETVPTRAYSPGMVDAAERESRLAENPRIS